MNEFTFVFINTMIYLKSPVYYYSSFNTREIYICMTSMMMLENTMEVSVNNDLPLKGRAQTPQTSYTADHPPPSQHLSNPHHKRTTPQ